MPVPKENIVDLRKSPSPQAPETPRDKKRKKTKETIGMEIKPNILVISSAGVILAGLVTYFALSQNYLASFLFILAGAAVGVSIFAKGQPADLRARNRRKNPKSLTDILAKMIGL